MTDTMMETAPGQALARKIATEDLATVLLARADAEGVSLVGPGGLLGGLTKSVLEAGLEAELDEHPGYGPYDPAGRNSGNSRDGTRSKTVFTEIGPVEIDVPRDRAGTFEPVIVPKRRRSHLPAGAVAVRLGPITVVVVRAIHPDRSLTIQRIGGSGEAVVPADYVADHVELAYAVTAHQVQGRTVEAAHALISPTTAARSPLRFRYRRPPHQPVVRRDQLRPRPRDRPRRSCQDHDSASGADRRPN